MQLVPDRKPRCTNIRQKSQVQMVTGSVLAKAEHSKLPVDGLVQLPSCRFL